MYKVLICGSRTFGQDDRYGRPDPVRVQMIRQVLQDLKAEYYGKGTLRIIEGAAKGADTIAGCVADELGLEVVEYPAQWDKHGRGAGPIRNTQMLVEGKPDLVIAFSDIMPVGANIPITPGTQDMVVKAIRAGVGVQINIPPQKGSDADSV